MTEQPIFQKIRNAVEAVRARYAEKLEIGLVLGSGLGPLAAKIENPVVVPYTDIPHFHGTSVEGHHGQMVLGKFKGISCVMLQGRFHYYEGYPMEEVVFPARTLCGLGIHTLVLTNAAGGVNAKFSAGDLMVIEDHLNLMGDNPLRGKQIAQLGPRFPDLTEAYSRECLALMESAGREIGIPLHRGVYAGLLGPTYETPAEVRMLRTLGADAVGMSTVPEAIAAIHLGVRVVGVSCITNLAAGMTGNKLTHAEVIEISKIGAEKMGRLFELVIPRLTHKPTMPSPATGEAG
ncbi:MAG: purine-nucleoside phosphorylase [Bdellovibrionota bacterium]